MKNLFHLCEKYFNTKNLYEVLDIEYTASPGKIRKAFYKLSLGVHPDRVSEGKEIATEKFKVLKLVHSLLSDAKQRKLYDQTGGLDEEDDEIDFKSDTDWRLYCNFNDITDKDISDYETNYKGSPEEMYDLKIAYMEGKGDMDLIFELIPFSHPSEEERYRSILNELIKKEEILCYDKFINESIAKRNRRKRKIEKDEQTFENKDGNKKIKKQ